MEPANDLTRMIRLAGQGDADAAEHVASRVYEELREVSARLMRSERQVTLQPTALANEALIRLLNGEAMAQAPDRAYFFASAAKAMRRILVDEYRKRNAAKRGGGMERYALSQILEQYDRQNIDVSDLDEALSALEALSPRQAKVVHLRWFMDFKVAEIADLLEVSVSTVEQDWRAARAFLKLKLDAD